jgi:hypothetical protein
MELKIEYIAVEDLKPYEKNNKKHEDFDVGEIAKSIDKYGMVDPIGIWKGNVIVEGHGRLLACKKLGIDTVPCIRLDHLTDEQRREYAIVHNKSSELALYDFDNLADELAELDLSDFDFDFGIDTDAEESNYSPDEFGEDFTLAEGDRAPIQQMTFTLHDEQAELIKYAMDCVKDDIQETFGNTNKNGNALYEVVRQWAEQRK